jgi:hypothetical protein
MIAYDTVTEAVSGLKKRGYSIDFNLEFDQLICHKTAISLRPRDFEITEMHRFEGMTDPADEAVVFAIEGKDGTKGILVDGFGPSAETLDEEMVKKLRKQ